MVLTVIAKGATKNDVVESYQWYKDGKKLAAETGKTLTIATDKASDSEYYCKVVFANDKVNGQWRQGSYFRLHQGDCQRLCPDR